MRFLLACPECRRQLDVTGHAVGARLRCSCGAMLTVPQPRGHDAAVVRCSACGAPREGNAQACRFCGSSFTLHDRDLDTLCPQCMARVSGRSRFCHWCGTPILATQAASPETELRCPSCPVVRPLASRRLGASSVAVFECGHCGGLWVEKEVFEVMAARARAGSLPEPLMRSAPPASQPRDTEETGGGHAYRPCVLCGALMNRRNYGRKSGVIVDVCSRHGIWFDLHELDGLLRWLRQAGEERAQALAAEEEREAARQKAFAEGVEPLRLTAEDRRQELAAGSRLGGVLAFLLGMADLRHFFGDD